jgi:hypothetical protein
MFKTTLGFGMNNVHIRGATMFQDAGRAVEVVAAQADGRFTAQTVACSMGRVIFSPTEKLSEHKN